MMDGLFRPLYVLWEPARRRKVPSRDLPSFLFLQRGSASAGYFIYQLRTPLSRTNRETKLSLKVTQRRLCFTAEGIPPTRSFHLPLSHRTVLYCHVGGFFSRVYLISSNKGLDINNV